MNLKSILSKMSASQLRHAMEWKCPLKGHRGHSGLEHFSCYVKLHGLDLKEKIAFFDVESESLTSEYGILFCWKLLDNDTNKMYGDVLTLDDIKKGKSTKREVQPKEDKRIVQSLVNCLSNYDRVIGHFSSRFDLPMIRSRAIICGVEFPSYGALYQTDTWQILKNKFKLRRNSLENATRNLVGQSRKDHLSLAIKHGCLRGEKWALDATFKHCHSDVLDLRELYNKIVFSVKSTKTSI